jgi:hypothetical protein
MGHIRFPHESVKDSCLNAREKADMATAVGNS